MRTTAIENLVGDGPPSLVVRQDTDSGQWIVASSAHPTEPLTGPARETQAQAVADAQRLAKRLAKEHNCEVRVERHHAGGTVSAAGRFTKKGRE